MKSLKITIYKILFFIIIVLPELVVGQRFSIEAGIYDYTDNVAREFYLLSPTVLFGYDFYMIKKLRINFSGGIGYRQFKYHNNRHQLYTVPLFLSALYDFKNNGAKLYPSAGMGFSAMYKSDRNMALSGPHQSFTYGYHFKGELNYRLPKLTLFFEIRYNYLLPPAMEEIKLSGIMPMIGLKILTLKKRNY